MPLKTKRPLPATKLNHNAKGNTKLPGKALCRQGNGSKNNVRQEKKPPRTKAGYSLYSTQSDEQHSSYSRAIAQNSCAKFTTLVEDWIAHQNDSKEAEASENTQAYDTVHDRTPFNRRLVSSTPDPDKVLDEMSDDEQVIPERDTDHPVKANSTVGPSGTCSQKMPFDTVLTDCQRQELRRQIDAALLAEGYTELTQKQLHESCTSQRDMPGEGRTAPSGPRRKKKDEVQKKPCVSFSKSKYQNVGYLQTPALRSADESDVSAVEAWQHVMGKERLQARDSDIGVFQHFLHRDSSALGPPLAFLQEKSSEHTSCSVQVFVPQGNGSFAPNLSMGFMPSSTEHAVQPITSAKTVPGSRLPSSSASSQTFQPLSIKIDGRNGDQWPSSFVPDTQSQSGILHLSIPACSPSKPKRANNQGLCQVTNLPQFSQISKQVTVTMNDNRAAALKTNSKLGASQEMPTPAANLQLAEATLDFHPTAVCLADLPSPRSRAILGRGLECAAAGNSSNNARQKMVFPRAHATASKVIAVQNLKSVDNYTCDGYFINQSQLDPSEDNSLVPTPRSYIPTPMHSPDRQRVFLDRVQSNDMHLNKNNNSDSWSRSSHDSTDEYQAGKESGNRKSVRREALPNFMLQFAGQMKPAREALADDFEEITLTNAVTTGDDHDEIEPPNPAPTPASDVPCSSHDVLNGPRRLRQLIFELSQTCAIDGDMEICQLVQEISNLIETLPQLKVSFNLQAEIDLALQPLRNDNSQLRRRLRILNQQLKERERREREGCSPGMEFEMLHLQTENASLLRQLKEERERCKKLNLQITEQQQQIEKDNKELHLLKTKMSEIEHGKLIERQEQTQDIKGLHQELEMMSRRNESVQLKLASADRENNILHLNIRQSDIEITRLQNILGNLKQGVCEVLQFFDQSVGNLDRTDAGLQKLLSFLKANSQPYNPITSDLRFYGDRLVDQPGNSRDMKESRPQPKGTNSDTREKSETSCLPHSLTVAALAAHNQQQMGMKMQKNLSFHSWDGGKSLSPPDKSLPYHSDPESRTSPQKRHGSAFHHHHRPVDQQNKGLSKQSCSYVARDKQKDFLDRSDTSLGNVSLEMHSEMVELPRDITKQDGTPTEKSQDISNCTRYSITKYFKKYPASGQTVEELEKSSASSDSHDASVSSKSKTNPLSSSPKGSTGPKLSLPVSSSSSLAASVTPDVIQQDFFAGTELDMSLSTIPDDASSVATGVTRTSISTAMSLDDHVFREGIAALDKNIAKVHEALQRTKKMFS